MKTSITNLLLDATAKSNVIANPGEGASNILDKDTGMVYAVEGYLDITISNIGGISSDMIALFNVYFDNTLIMTLYDSNNKEIDTVVFTQSDWTGWTRKALLYNKAYIDLEKIKITTDYIEYDDYIDKYIGYIWAGAWLDFQCQENSQPFSLSDDSITITRSNRPDENDSYEYRSWNITLNKRQAFKELRGKCEQVLFDGFGKGRPFLFTGIPYENELYYANLDSNKIGYDLIWDNSKQEKYTAQATLGVRECT